MRDQDAVSITSKLNEVADAIDTSLDPFVEAASYDVFKRIEQDEASTR